MLSKRTMSSFSKIIRSSEFVMPPEVNAVTFARPLGPRVWQCSGPLSVLIVLTYVSSVSKADESNTSCYCRFVGLVSAPQMLS
jgi:hypothetical protein